MFGREKQSPPPWEKRFEERPRRTAFNVGVSLIFIGLGLALVGGVGSLVIAPFFAAKGVVERTIAPDNIIANYEWFKRQVQDVKAMDVRLDVSRRTLEQFKGDAGPRERWTFEDKQEYARLSSVVLGLEGQRAGMVAEYNARTEMANRALFKTSDLPPVLQ